MLQPTSSEFLLKFIEAFTECYPETPEARSIAWTNWTAFIMGKEGKTAGYWTERQVLPLTAKKLGLRHDYEYLNLDLVMFPAGEKWGNLVAIEHENEITRFGEEVEKLLSVLAPLKVGITYDLNDNAGNRARTESLISNYFSTRHEQIHEAPGTEYLFLLGVVGAAGSLAWRFISFNTSNGPTNCQFQDTANVFLFEAAAKPRVLRSSAGG